MSTTPSLPAPPLTEHTRRAVRSLGPWRAGAIAYLVVALAAGAILGALVAGLAWGAVELVRRHRGRPPAVLADGRFHPSHGLVELVLGAVVVRRDGIGGTVLRLVVVGALAVIVGVVAVGLVTGAAHRVALILGLLVAATVALWRRHNRREHPELWPRKPGDVTVAAYVEARSFPSDTVADFVTSEAATLTLSEARAIADAYSAGQAAERYAAYRRRSDAARRR